MAYTKYSLTPASNTAAPPDGAPEGMLPSAVNDTMRDMMAQIRDCGDGIRGGTYTMTAPVITGGSVTGVTFSSSSATITGGSVTGITDLTVADGGTGASTVAAAQTNLQVFNFKNRIINGDMRIDQRNAGASVATSSGTFLYSLDRWQAIYAQTSKYTIQQNAGSVTPPVGFTNYLGVTSTSAYTVGSSDYFSVRQIVEGLNIGDLSWGTANAKTVTLSFQVYSSLTGTFGGCLTNGAENRSYPFSYTVSSANTWTSVSVTIAGDTSGTWLTTNGQGIQIRFGLGAGSTFLGTAGAWAAGNYIQPTGTVSVVGTSGATFYITGVQLEVGSSATGFEYNDYGRQLIQCQRYFEKSYDISTALATATTSGQTISSGTVGGLSTSYIEGSTVFKVTKRATPTITAWDPSGNSGKCSRTYSGNSSSANQAFGAGNLGMTGFSYNSSGTANANVMSFQWTSEAEL